MEWIKLHWLWRFPELMVVEEAMDYLMVERVKKLELDK